MKVFQQIKNKCYIKRFKLQFQVHDVCRSSAVESLDQHCGPVDNLEVIILTAARFSLFMKYSIEVKMLSHFSSIIEMILNRNAFLLIQFRCDKKTDLQKFPTELFMDVAISIKK